MHASAPQTFTIAVGAVNDAPTISNVEDKTINEDGSTGPISFTVKDADGDGLTVGGASSNQELVPDANVILGGEGEDRTVTVEPEPGKSGTAEITLTVDDGSNTDNATASETFLLTVNDVNTGPSDTTAPTTRASLSTQPNPAGWHRRDVTVTLDAADEEGGSGVKEIVYKTNGGEYRPYSAPFTVSPSGSTRRPPGSPR